MSAAETVVAGSFARFIENVRATLKAREIEETLDVYFYRPLGYVVARIGYALGISPNMVTVCGMVLGLVGSHFFLHPIVSLNMWGMTLLVIAETFDAADGQLARMTGRFSAFGRILDGLGSNVIFASIYVHLWLRLSETSGRLVSTLCILGAGLSHSMQCAVADFYRNAYLLAVYGEAEQEKSGPVAERYAQLSWRRTPAQKLLMRFYLNYVREQEMLARGFLTLQRAAEPFGRPWPSWIGEAYRAVNQRLIKYYNVITSNTRMIALGVALYLGHPLFYLAFEMVALNALLAVTLWRQNRHDFGLAERVARAAAQPAGASA